LISKEFNLVVTTLMLKMDLLN